MPISTHTGRKMPNEKANDKQLRISNAEQRMRMRTVIMPPIVPRISEDGRTVYFMYAA